MQLNRRSFLLGSTSIAVASALSGVFNIASANVKNITSEQYAKLCKRWGDIITGRDLIDPKNSLYTSVLESLDRSVEGVLKDLVREPNRTTVLASTDLSEEKSPAITKTSRSALTLATGWATPGCKYYQDETVLKDAIDALKDFLRLRYNPQQEEYGNWWDWESGASRAVGDMMCLLRDQLPKEVMQAAAAGIDHFVPDPWFLRTVNAAGSSGANDKKTVATGANRLDLSRAVICRAIATGDSEKVRHALAGLPETWEMVTEGDGFYLDGSFIQHKTIPYTGSYGDVLIGGLAMLFTLVSGSEFDMPEAHREAVYWAVNEAFIPVIIDSQVLDAVRGRSVSRYTEPGSLHGRSIMKAILLLAQGAPEQLATRWKGICRAWIERNSYNKLSEIKNIAHLALFMDALQAPIAPVDTLPRMFPSMDRLVHRTPDWTMAISLCSRRIAWYECGNQENELASRTGSGMRYLYLPHDMGQFEDNFWPTIDYSAPVGTTVDTHSLERQVAGEWGHITPQNEWTGGVTQASTSLAAMHFIGPDNNGLTARRVWVGTDKNMLELVTDVRTQATQAMTVVEHRNLGENGQNKLVVNGETITDARQIEQARWAHLESVCGGR